MLAPPEAIKPDPMSENEDVLVAVGSVASFTGEQAGALLIIIQVLARHRLISMGDARKLVRLLSAESPDVERRMTSQCASRRKARPIRQSVTSTRCSRARRRAGACQCRPVSRNGPRL